MVTADELARVAQDVSADPDDEGKWDHGYRNQSASGVEVTAADITSVFRFERSEQVVGKFAGEFDVAGFVAER